MIDSQAIKQWKKSLSCMQPALIYCRRSEKFIYFVKFRFIMIWLDRNSQFLIRMCSALHFSAIAFGKRKLESFFAWQFKQCTLDVTVCHRIDINTQRERNRPQRQLLHTFVIASIFFLSFLSSFSIIVYLHRFCCAVKAAANINHLIKYKCTLRREKQLIFQKTSSALHTTESWSAN